MHDGKIAHEVLGPGTANLRHDFADELVAPIAVFQRHRLHSFAYSRLHIGMTRQSAGSSRRRNAAAFGESAKRDFWGVLQRIQI